MRERRTNLIIFACTILAIPVVLVGVGVFTVHAGVAAVEQRGGCLDPDGDRPTWLKNRTVGAVGFHRCSATDSYDEGAVD